MGLTFRGRKDRLSLSENYSDVQLIRKQQVETQRQGEGVAALEVGGGVKTLSQGETAYDWKPGQQEASHALGPKGLEKWAVFLNRREHVPIKVRGQGKQKLFPELLFSVQH